MIGALYIHIPFCASRCAYCDFATSACHDDALMDAYVDSLSLQLRRASRAGLLADVRTIYIGGGTPTHLGTRRLNSLAYLLSLSVNLEGVCEFSVEANPESLTEAMVRDLHALGVNRYSIGAQSFEDAELATFRRVHDASDIARACEAAGSRGDAFSLDLIAGCPGQTSASWKRSVERAIALGACHVSVYPLSVEDGTPLACAIAAGELAAPDDDAQADMMLSAAELLERAGLQRYETASYAKPGCACRHNIAYWTGVEYLGLGAAAASMLSPDAFAACHEARVLSCGERDASQAADSICTRVRAAASADVSAYIAASGCAQASLECLDARQAVLEDAMLGMRRSCGLADEFVAQARERVPQLGKTLAELEGLGLVEHAGKRWVPSERGWLCGNDIFGAIWGLA